MSDVDFILGDVVMRRGDRLPMLALALESDIGVPLDLTDADSVTLLLRHQDGLDVLTVAHPGLAEHDGWLVLPALVYDPPNGVVIYDWPQSETTDLQIGVMDMVVEALWTNRKVTVPTDRSARLIVRDSAV